MNQKELQEHYKRVFDTVSGKEVLLDLERVTNTTRLTADSPNPYSAIFIVAQQQLLKRIRNMTQLRTAKIEKENIMNVAMMLIGLVTASANDSILSQVQHDFADNEGVKIHYVVMGEVPLVVMIHGFPDFWYS